MPLSDWPDSPPHAAAAAITVDDLEARINALHNYLSTPYRTRAEAILRQRRERESSLAESAATTPRTRRSLFHMAQSTAALPYILPPPTETRATTSEATHSIRETPVMVTQDAKGRRADDDKAEARAPTSPALSLFTDTASRQEATSTTGRSSAALSPSFFPPSQRSDGGRRRQVHMPASQDEEEEQQLHQQQQQQEDLYAVHPMMEQQQQQRIARLEWQVQMLSAALREERDRNTRIHAQVVVPLREMMETSLRRQLELECEIAQLRNHQHQGQPQQQEQQQQ